MSRARGGRLGKAGTLAERMAHRTEKTATCWLWVGDINSFNGYGRLQHHGVRRTAHRIAYEMAKGPIPDGLVIDHLCRVRHCVNPDHLEAVLPRVNTERGFSFAAIAARATHCIRNHPLFGDNVYVTRNGRRQCKTCANERRRAVRVARAAS